MPALKPEFRRAIEALTAAVRPKEQSHVLELLALRKLIEEVGESHG